MNAVPSRSTSGRALRVAVALSFAVLAHACTSYARQEHLDSKEAHWKSAEVESPSDRVLWQLTLLSLQTQGYPLAAGTDSGARIVETGWKTDMQPFRGEGERRKAVVRMEPLEKGRWKLESRVMCEKNQNLVAPLDPVRAEWTVKGDDDAAAEILLQHICSRLRPELPVEAGKTEAAKKP